MSLEEKLTRVIPRPLWPYLGALRRFVYSVPPRPYFEKKRLLLDLAIDPSDREVLSKVSSRIYFNDGMYYGAGADYFRVGLLALHCVNDVLETAGIREISTILDMACGGGRVLRFLRQRFPDAEITACELQSGPVQFCVRTFDAKRAISSVNLDEISIDRRFDLIWCGSLLTHLRESGIAALLRLFKRHLAPGGIVVFTTHGEPVARTIPAGTFDYGLTPEQKHRIGDAYAATGYGYEDYPYQTDYGISVTSPEWIRARVREVGGLREVLFKESGWNEHQDVFGFRRIPER